MLTLAFLGTYVNVARTITLEGEVVTITCSRPDPIPRVVIIAPNGIGDEAVKALEWVAKSATSGVCFTVDCIAPIDGDSLTLAALYALGGVGEPDAFYLSGDIETKRKHVMKINPRAIIVT